MGNGLKVAGAGNGAGLLACGAALQYFGTKPDIVFLIKIAAFFFLAGLLCFTFALLILMGFVVFVQKFILAKPEHAKAGWPEMTLAIKKYHPRDYSIYALFAFPPFFHLSCFVCGCLFAFDIVWRV
jgi:membrane-bound ClpP family serine protease